MRRPGFGKVLHHDDLVAASRAGGKLDLHEFGVRGEHHPFYLFESLDPGLYQRSMGSARRKFRDELLVLGEHGLLPLEGRDQLLAPDFPFAEIKVVVAGIGRDRSRGNLHRARTEARHEFAVMARHDEVAGKPAEPFLEPDDGFHVKVVGRFVHEEDVRIEHEYAGKGDAHFPAARKIFHGFAETYGTDPESGKHCFGAVFEVVAVPMEKFTLQFPVYVHFGVAEGNGGRIGHAVFELCQFFADLEDRAGTGENLVKGAAARHFADILRKIADNRARIHRDGARIVFFLAGDYPEERGLARAVRTDKADPVAGTDQKIGVVQDDAVPVGDADTGQFYHDGTPAKEASIAERVHRVTTGRISGRTVVSACAPGPPQVILYRCE